jgi:hypothetical protein
MLASISVAASLCNRLIQSFVLLVLHSRAPASCLSCDSSFGYGRAVAQAFSRRVIAQAVSRWLPTAAARVRVRAEHMVFVVDKGALG